MSKFRWIVSCALLACALAPAFAEQWPGWRGPRGDGTSSDTKVPLHWTATENIAWKTAIAGTGHSSPVVCAGRVFVTSCILETQERVLVCLDRKDGQILWRKTVLTSPLEKKHSLNSFASATPATDGSLVWVTFLRGKDLMVSCYDYEGQQVWARSPGEFHSVHGFCSSPLLYKDTIIVNADQDAPAYIVALDKKTGAERWRADRPNRIRSYCAPLIAEAAGKMQMVLTGCKCVASYDPDTGKQYWIVDGPTEQFVASPILVDGTFFLTAGFPDYHNMAIRPDGSGNVTRTHVVWHEARVTPKKAAYVPSPIGHGHYAWVISDTGWLSCFEALTGKRQYFQQLGDHHSASPVSAGEHLYFTADNGTTSVVKAGPKFEIVARNPIGEECYASPAISDGQIFLRGTGHLFCIGKEFRP